MPRKTSSQVGTTAKGKKAASKRDGPDPSSISSRYHLPASSENPPHLFVLPRHVTPEARIVSLPNPRHDRPTRYLFCPSSGFYEFTKAAARRSTPRSWLLEQKREACDHEARKKDDTGHFPTQTTRSADLFVATPIDPLFLIVPALHANMAPCSHAKGTSQNLVLEAGDHIGTLEQMSRGDNHLSELLRIAPHARALLERRLVAVCERSQFHADQDPTFRLDEDKLLAELLRKAQRMARKMPASLEDKFVKKPLEAPILGVRSSQSGSGEPIRKKGAEDNSSGSQPQLSTSSRDPSVAGEVAEAAAIVSAMTPSDALLSIQRLRVAFDFITSTYLPPKLADSLGRRLATGASIKTAVDFSPLDEYMAKLGKLKLQAAATRTSNFSRKRAPDEDDEHTKRRKKDEADKRKVPESRAVKALRKVDTSGMRKMSDFFKKT